jgi:hypothetical protein
MGWWKWHRGGPYPGHGPWSHLPPELRPGYWGWWRLGAPMWDKEYELRYLEELKRYITEILKEIDRRIEELKK